MADSVKQIARFWPGLAAAGFVAALTVGTLVAVGLRAEGWQALSPSDWAAVRFTVFQALLSAALSVVFAIPVARALARRKFFGRSLLITLLGAPFILPVIIAVLGLIEVFGRNGLVSVVLVAIGLEPLSIYGLPGVVLAHVFFNLPLAVRLILQGWLSIPSERFRLAASLNFSSKDVLACLERPMLRAIIPGTFVAIFVICTTSFAVALTLGGGPRATTVELAIFQAFRFDFNLAKAAQLATLQFGICLIAAGIAYWVHIPAANGAGLDRIVARFDARSLGNRIIDVCWIGSAAVFLMVPLSMIVLRGVPGVFDALGLVGPAAVRSICIAFVSSFLAVSLGLAVAISVHGYRSRPKISGALESVGYLAIASSPLVIGTGLFILIFPLADPIALALPITAMVNAMMSLPFVLRSLIPAVADVENRYGGLADSLNMVGWARLSRLYFPRLRRPLGFSAGLAAALSMGDLGVVALFADPNAATLPLQLYRLMASYRMQDAAGAALLLLFLTLVLFWIFDRGGRVDADT